MLTLERDRRVGPLPALREGLISLIPFTDGTVRPRDMLSNSRPTTFQATLARDQWGQSVLQFNGTDQRLFYPGVSDYSRPTTEITVYTRFYWNGLGSVTNDMAIGAKSYGAGTEYSYGLSFAGDARVVAYVHISGTIRFAQQTVGVPQDKWLNLFARWTSGGPVTVEGYYDGGRLAVTRASSANFSGTIDTNTEALYFGCDASQTDFIGGFMHTHALWDRRLSDGELLLLASDPGILFRHTFLSMAQVAAIPAGVAGQDRMSATGLKYIRSKGI